MQYHAGVSPRGPRCLRCKEIGHLAVRCRNNPILPRCSLCGRGGHQQPRCPYQICLQCGASALYTTNFCSKCHNRRHRQCTLCCMVGHSQDICPDLWRRYFLTTHLGPLTTLSEPQMKPPNKQWCSGCGKPGHLEFTCNYLNRKYPPIDPQIHCYQDIYNSVPDRIVSASTSATTLNNFQVQINNPPSQSQTNPINEEATIFEILTDQTEGDFSLLNKSATNYCKYPQQLNNNNMAINPVNFSLHAQRPNQEQINQNTEKFMSLSTKDLQVFIGHELSKLLTISKRNARALRKRFFGYETSLQRKGGNGIPLKKQQEKDMMHFFKTLNMFIFGVHGFRDGGRHVNFLQHFLTISTNNHITRGKRAAIQEAYEYIFRTEKHPDVSYNKFLRIIITGLDKRL